MPRVVLTAALSAIKHLQAWQAAAQQQAGASGRLTLRLLPALLLSGPHHKLLCGPSTLQQEQVLAELSGIRRLVSFNCAMRSIPHDLWGAGAH